MQLNKQLIIIMILASLLLSSIAAAFYFYKKNQKALQNNNELVTIYIAKDDIKKGTLLELKHLAQTQIAKQFILNKPLVKEEILGKYTNETIYKHEIFLKQKIGEIKKEKGNKLLEFKNNSYNIAFSLFENPNYSLQQGDLVKIISVYGKGKKDNKGKYNDYKVQYIVNKVKVLGFIRDGHIETKTITKQLVKKVVQKKVVEEELNVKADELVLDIQTNTLLSLIKDYNKGNQLWMVKTKESDLKEVIINKKPVIISKNPIKKPYKINYAFKLYKGENKTITRTASINYGDEKDTINKRFNIVTDYQKICRNIKNNFIIGKTNSFYIRSEASKKSKYRKLLKKNTIIPYLNKYKDWYQTCDQKYIHKSVVDEISANQVKLLLGASK